ncbi:MAG TPA: tail fiber domain-containing protein [Kofleriaceae bacterium]
MARKQMPDVLDQIDRIRVVSWEWNDVARDVGLEPGERSIGVIAQELAVIFPELVSTHEVDGYQGVNYGGLAAIAIAGVQQLRRELADVRSRSDRGRRTKRRATDSTAPRVRSTKRRATDSASPRLRKRRP